MKNSTLRKHRKSAKKINNQRYRTSQLREYVDVKSTDITNEMLIELEEKLNFSQYTDEDYEYNGNFIVTTDESVFTAHCDTLCCGIETRVITLNNGIKIYFAFDYGH